MEAIRSPVGGAHLQPEHVEGRDGLEEPLESEPTDRLGLDQALDRGSHARRDEDLPTLGLTAETRRVVRDCADGAVIPAALEPDGADRRIALSDPDGEGEIPTPLAPARALLFHALAHRDRH